jgi:hypothetical protein
MFKIKYIYELISGELSVEGYRNILSGIFSLVKKYNWSKAIIVSINGNPNYWSAEDVKEFTHQFFEYAIEKKKFSYLNKIPENYRRYYFTQIIVSFVANRISEVQQKSGLSFDKCRELVSSIIKEKYFSKSIGATVFTYNKSFEEDDIKDINEVEHLLTYLPHYRIPESANHYKSFVGMAIEDIFGVMESPVAIKKLIETVFRLFDQSFLSVSEFNAEEDESCNEDDHNPDGRKYSLIINSLLAGMSKEDAKIISEYLFQSNGKISLSELAKKYQLPKSTVHHKTESFKKKISQTYMPENEDDGINFIQNLSSALDELAK